METLATLPPSEPRGKQLIVQGIPKDYVAYNPAPIVEIDEDGNETTSIALRVEHKDSDWKTSFYNPSIMFFTREGDTLNLIPDAPVFEQHEDPFATWITDPQRGRQLLFGGVTADPSNKEVPVTTNIYLASSVKDLDPYTEPFRKIAGMRDIRFAQLRDGHIAVLTRSQKGDAFPGKIGFTIIDNIDDLSQEVVDAAPLLHFAIDPTMKMGSNEVHVVEIDGKELLHVFCHVANEPTSDTDPLRYELYDFYLDPADPFGSQISPRKLVIREDFGELVGPHKRDRFEGIIFPGGTGGSRRTKMYVGIRDAHTGEIDLVA